MANFMRDLAIAPRDVVYQDGVDLPDVEDATFYMTLPFVPERQCVVLFSRLQALAGSRSTKEKIRWLDLQFSHNISPYPIQHIEFTFKGDAVVQFISEASMKKSVSKGPFRWDGVDVGTRPCQAEDIRSLYWLGISYCPQEYYPSLGELLVQYGDIMGEYPPHPCQAMNSRMLKFYFIPNGRKIPHQLKLYSTSKTAPSAITVKLFLPDGHLSPKCLDFGALHSEYSCPECYRRRMAHRGHQIF